jgi:sugar-specific transcriptional regulator TrmB
VPKARIYEVLDELADMGYVEVYSGRPMEYRSRSPEDILQAKVENERRSYEAALEAARTLEREFIPALSPLYTAGLGENPRTELLRIVRVGEASERETRLLYEGASREIDIISKVLEYLPKVEDVLAAAVERGVRLRVLLLSEKHLTPQSAEVQRTIVDRLRERIPSADVRLARTRQPLRGSFVDPSMDYDGGRAILMVEEPATPLFLRDAAVTENPSMVAALLKYFEATWEHDSDPAP